MALCMRPTEPDLNKAYTKPRVLKSIQSKIRLRTVDSAPQQLYSAYYGSNPVLLHWAVDSNSGSSYSAY